MSDEEQLANDLALGVSAARRMAENYGFAPNDAQAVQSHAVGMFIVWLTAMEEGRHLNLGTYRSFREAVIERLPLMDDPTWPDYIRPGPVAPLRQRAEALWGIRVAVTHGGGDTSKISSAQNRSFALSATLVIPGVALTGAVLDLSGCNLHTPIRTMQQIRDILR